MGDLNNRVQNETPEYEGSDAAWQAQPRGAGVSNIDVAPTGQSRYSLISLEKADEEELIIISSSGISQQTLSEPNNTSVRVESDASVENSKGARDFAHDSYATADSPYSDAEHLSATMFLSDVSSSSQETAQRTTSEKRQRSDDEESVFDSLTEDDLNGSVPLQNMHKAILVLIVVGLVAFGVYFFLFK